jgi:hypothetical protein
MKTDRYTKIVLTVIAACLVFQTLAQLELVPSAFAQMSGSRVASDVTKVSICNPGGDQCGDSWVQYVRAH